MPAATLQLSLEAPAPQANSHMHAPACGFEMCSETLGGGLPMSSQSLVTSAGQWHFWLTLLRSEVPQPTTRIPHIKALETFGLPQR